MMHLSSRNETSFAARLVGVGLLWCLLRLDVRQDEIDGVPKDRGPWWLHQLSRSKLRSCRWAFVILLVRFVSEVVDLDARRHGMSSISQYHRFRTYLDLSCY